MINYVFLSPVVSVRQTSSSSSCQGEQEGGQEPGLGHPAPAPAPGPAPAPAPALILQALGHLALNAGCLQIYGGRQATASSPLVTGSQTDSSLILTCLHFNLLTLLFLASFCSPCPPPPASTSLLLLAVRPPSCRAGEATASRLQPQTLSCVCGRGEWVVYTVYLQTQGSG